MQNRPTKGPGKKRPELEKCKEDSKNANSAPKEWYWVNNERTQRDPSESGYGEKGMEITDPNSKRSQKTDEFEERKRKMLKRAKRRPGAKGRGQKDQDAAATQCVIYFAIPQSLDREIYLLGGEI